MTEVSSEDLSQCSLRNDEWLENLLCILYEPQSPYLHCLPMYPSLEASPRITRMSLAFVLLPLKPDNSLSDIWAQACPNSSMTLF